MIKNKVMEYLNGQIKENIKAIGKMENNMEKGFLLIFINNMRKIFIKKIFQKIYFKDLKNLLHIFF